MLKGTGHIRINDEKWIGRTYNYYVCKCAELKKIKWPKPNKYMKDDKNW